MLVARRGILDRSDGEAIARLGHPPLLGGRRDRSQDRHARVPVAIFGLESRVLTFPCGEDALAHRRGGSSTRSAVMKGNVADEKKTSPSKKKIYPSDLSRSAVRRSRSRPRPLGTRTHRAGAGQRFQGAHPTRAARRLPFEGPHRRSGHRRADRHRSRPQDRGRLSADWESLTAFPFSRLSIPSQGNGNGKRAQRSRADHQIA